MNKNLAGWAFVAAQAVLIIALVLVPSRDDWATPGWVNAVGSIFFFAGFVIMAIAALRLGTALTPTPVPTKRGKLTTAGLYKYVRHPIYTGVLAIVVGLVIPSGSLISLAIGVVTFLFFDRKARWEEARLAERYSEYASYASVTPRFVPQPWRTS